MELKNSHGGNAGPTLISRIQDDLDNAYTVHVSSDGKTKEEQYGVVCGIALALSRLRSSSYGEEIQLAQERYKAKQNAEDGVMM